MDLSMSKEEIEKYLSQPLVARLATIGKDGYPNVHPMWFIYEGGEIIIGTGTGTVKTKNVRDNQKVGVVIDTAGETEMKGVIFRGKAELVEDETKEMTKKIILRYLGTTDDPMYQQLIQMPRTLIKIRPEKTYSWDFSKMGA